MARFLRLPFTLVALWDIHVTMTPPNATPPDDERKTFKALDIERAAVPFALLSKAVFYFAFIGEAISIIRSPSPTRISLPLILSFFTHTIGAYIRVRCYRTLSSQFTFELAIRRNHHLVTHGPYAIVRHPSYIGALMVAAGCVGHVLDDGSWLSSCCSLSAWWQWRWVCAVAMLGFATRTALIPRMEKEDVMLRDAFGEEWEIWRKTVPYKIIPNVY